MSVQPFLNKGRVFDGAMFLQKNIEYDSEGLELFIGYAAPGTTDDADGWLIVKKTRDVELKVTSERFADGSILFDKVWDSRNAYAYA